MSEALKKRKSKVLRSEGGTPEMKRGRGEGEQQVTLGRRWEKPVSGNGRTVCKGAPACGLATIYCVNNKKEPKIETL